MAVSCLTLPAWVRRRQSPSCGCVHQQASLCSLGLIGEALVPIVDKYLNTQTNNLSLFVDSEKRNPCQSDMPMLNKTMCPQSMSWIPFGIRNARASNLTLYGRCRHHEMTPLQNDPQQHQRDAKHQKFRAPHGGKPSPDSESARKALQTSGLGSHIGPQTCDFTSNSGGGTTAGAPTHARVRPSRNQCTTETISRTSYRVRCWGKIVEKGRLVADVFQHPPGNGGTTQRGRIG
jgi:hypothetical protein